MSGLFEQGEPEAGPDFFEEALAFWRQKVPMSAGDFNGLTAQAQKKAFKVARMTQLETVAAIYRAIDKAIEEGTTLADFKKDVGEHFEGRPGLLETVFRTNLQTAYSAGTHLQQTDPAVLKVFPYWKFVALLDSRTTRICSALNGTVRPASDPWWSSHIPPLHFQCRATKTALTDEEAAELGIAEAGPAVAPQEGFGNPLAEYEPSLADFPPELSHLF